MTPGSALYDALGRPQKCAWATLPAWDRERYEAHARGIHDWRQAPNGEMVCRVCRLVADDCEEAA